MDTSTPRLSEYARKFVYPPTITKTVWPRIEAKGRDLGLGFDWWQSQLGTVCVGYGDDGKYVATVGGIGISIPRQVGKTYFVLALLVIMCVLFPGLQVVWTAHHLRTSTKTFTSLRGICGRKKVAPHVKAMRAANGEQQVEFNNGSMIMFGARSMGFGRGFDEIDIEVFDEAQILDTKALEDMVAATNQARHEHGALLFFMGTPPRPTDPSEAFAERRKEAWSGEADDAIWLEIGADPASDPNDRSQWARMNPSFPKRTPLESMLRLRKNLKDEDSWNREGRGIWDDDTEGWAIPKHVWTRLEATDRARPVGKVAFAVDSSPNNEWTSISVAGRREDGLLQVQVIDRRPNQTWAVDRLAELAAKWDVCAVVVDPQSTAGSLVGDLEKAGVRVTAMTAGEVVQACSQFYNAAVDEPRMLRHLGQEELTNALRGAKKRELVGAWAWNRRKATTDITPLVSATNALWGWTTRQGVGDILQAVW